MRCSALSCSAWPLCGPVPQKPRPRLFAETGKARADGLLPAGYDGMAGLGRYGWRTDPITGEETFHRGTDLACSEGTLVLAAMNGVVIAARRSATYGNYLCLSHSAGRRRFTPICNTSSFGPEKLCRQVSRWGQRGRRAAPPGRTFILSFWNRASAMMRGLCWACHEAARPAGAAGVP